MRRVLTFCAMLSTAVAYDSSDMLVDDTANRLDGAAVLQLSRASANIKTDSNRTGINRDTGDNDAGGYKGRNYYLDRHSISCESNEGLHRFQVNTRRRRRDWRINVEVACTSNDGLLSTEVRQASTGDNADGNGLVYYLDRHNVKCNDDEVLRSWKLTRPNNHNIRIDYGCSKALHPMQCNNHQTFSNSDGGENWGGMIYLDRHDVNCPYGEFLQKWKLKRDGSSNMYIKYRCCSVVAPEPTTTPPATPMPTFAPTTTIPPMDDDAITEGPIFTTPPTDQCNECRLDFSTLVSNPLGTSTDFVKHTDAQVLKFENVCTVNGKKLDLNMEIQSGYEGKPSQNKVESQMYILNLKLGTTATVKFSLFDQGEPALVDKVLITILDLDMGYHGTQWVSTALFSDTQVGNNAQVTTADGVTTFTASHFGDASDNPSSPMEIPPAHLDNGVAVIYSSMSEWTMTFGISGDNDSGRNFYLAGSTQLKITSC